MNELSTTLSMNRVVELRARSSPFNLSFIDYWRDSPRFSYVELSLDLSFLRF
ncbi:hypothetical protein [Leptospira noguchii]|uniref:hypothetical protein n=1 Tax=Leptospira noguchii TaxID=28182 RepID=UPI001FB7E1BA|nr:hypothetical protein [Leptospira noguchii]UOG48526.1 hypothetical protein MAL00_16355 [Leptospira noguchii]